MVSGISVAIPGRASPLVSWGHTRLKQRMFTDSETNFIGAIANVVAAAIERWQTELKRRQSNWRPKTPTGPRATSWRI